MDDAMIMVTRRNGSAFALNPDLIERVEATPDTVITLVAGTKYVVAEPVEQIIEEVRDFRASVLAVAGGLPPEAQRTGHLRSVSDLER
jgi:flagellar protein FlbD